MSRKNNRRQQNRQQAPPQRRPDTREVAVAQVTDKYSDYPSNGLTPVKLAEIFKEADAGDILRQVFRRRSPGHRGRRHHFRRLRRGGDQGQSRLYPHRAPRRPQGPQVQRAHSLGHQSRHPQRLHRRDERRDRHPGPGRQARQGQGHHPGGRLRDSEKGVRPG